MSNIDQELDEQIEVIVSIACGAELGLLDDDIVDEDIKRMNATIRANKDRVRKPIKSLITTQKQELLDEIEKELEPKLRELYYHDPDELGEDAFNNLGDDEVIEVLAIITTKREEV